MYNRLQQLISVAMALFVFISTLSISIEKHYCGDHLVDVSIFSEVEKCGMEVAKKGLDTSDESSLLITQSCCKDVVNFVEGQDELSLDKTKGLNMNQKVFIMSFASIFSRLSYLDLQSNKTFEHYSPPYFVNDIQVMNEVFLI